MADDDNIQRTDEPAQTELTCATAHTSARMPKAAPRRNPGFSVHLCIPDDQLAHLPKAQTLPVWPVGVQPPRTGEVVYLTSSSAWGVFMVIHEIVFGGHVRTEVWLKWVGASRDAECTFVH